MSDGLDYARCAIVSLLLFAVWMENEMVGMEFNLDEIENVFQGRYKN